MSTGAIIIGLIILALGIAYVTWGYYSQQEYIDKGCEPAAFGGPSGLVSIWSCPAND